MLDNPPDAGCIAGNEFLENGNDNGLKNGYLSHFIASVYAQRRLLRQSVFVTFTGGVLIIAA